MAVKAIYDKNCKIAMIVLAASIVLSGPIGFKRTMNGFYKDLQNEFLNGEYNDGLSIQNDLDYRVELAHNLTTVAKRYLDSDDNAVVAVLKTAQALSDANGPAEQFDANQELTAASTDLYEALGKIELSEKDEKYRRSIYADMNSRNDTIGNDPYNQLATEYNQKLEGFPAGLLSGLTGVKKAELFR